MKIPLDKPKYVEGQVYIARKDVVFDSTMLYQLFTRGNDFVEIRDDIKGGIKIKNNSKLIINKLYRESHYPKREFISIYITHPDCKGTARISVLRTSEFELKLDLFSDAGLANILNEFENITLKKYSYDKELANQIVKKTYSDIFSLISPVFVFSGRKTISVADFFLKPKIRLNEIIEKNGRSRINDWRLFEGLLIEGKIANDILNDINALSESIGEMDCDYTVSVYQIKSEIFIQFKKTNELASAAEKALLLCNSLSNDLSEGLNLYEIIHDFRAISKLKNNHVIKISNESQRYRTKNKEEVLKMLNNDLFSMYLESKRKKGSRTLKMKGLCFEFRSYGLDFPERYLALNRNGNEIIIIREC